MNSHTNPTKLAGSPCSCGGGASKPCSCGGAGCQVDTMIRPRFFAGQLLTEDDLQSLEDYVLAKNRLHNRHLFGAGVVCGLEVLCDPCGGGHVAVLPGYALDCCGNDISLDCRLSLDINAMVRDLRRDQLGGYDCGDPCAEQQQNLAKTMQPAAQPGQPAPPVEPPPPREYCLYVRYCEQESDPVSPYAVDEPCNAQSCEASRIREGIHFELRCPQSASPEPELITSILHCFQDVIGIEAMSVDALNLDSLRTQVTAGVTAAGRSFQDLRARLLDVVDRSPHLVKCKLREKILAVPTPVPVPGAAGVPNADPPATPALTAIFLEVLMECICMALNPPCTPCDDTGVKLACIKVQNCDVIEICNMSRHFVLAPASLRYWLSFAEIERMLAAACCSPPKLRLTVDQLIREGPPPLRARAAAAEGGTDQGGAGTGGETKPPDPPTAERDGAMKLRAIARALAEMNPDSDTGARFGRIADAFTALSGSKTASPGEDEVSRAERAAIDSSIATVVKDKIDPQTAQIKETLDEVSKLKEQVTALTAKIGTVRPPRAPRPPRESEPQ